MSERKKLKSSKDVQLCQQIIQLDTTGDFSNAIEKLDSIIELMKNKETFEIALDAIAKLYASNSSIISSRQLFSIFQSFVFLLKTRKVPVNSFLSCGILTTFIDIDLIKEMLGIYLKSNVNREVLKEVLASSIQVCSSRSEIIDLILEKHHVYIDLIPRISTYIDFSAISEEKYADIYLMCPFIRENYEMRVVKGRKKLIYVEKAIQHNFDFVATNYMKDKDKRVRLLIAKNTPISSVSYIESLVCDSDEDIRCAILNRLTWECISPKLATRLLDKSANVRGEMFRIFRDLTCQMKNNKECSYIFNSTCPKSISNGKINFSINQVTKITSESNSITDVTTMITVFTYFFEQLVLGCSTVLANEYIEVLKEADFTIDFLHSQKSIPKISAFLKSIKITDFASIPHHLRRFCLKYFSVSDLSQSQISECIETGVYEVVKIINDPFKFCNQLLNSVVNAENMSDVEMVVEFLKPALNQKNGIIEADTAEQYLDFNKGTESSTLKFFRIEETNNVDEVLFTKPSLFIVNSYTTGCFNCLNNQLLNQIEAEYLNTSENNGVDSKNETNLMSSYHVLYYLASKFKTDENVVKYLVKSNCSVEEKIKILLLIDNHKILNNFADSMVGTVVTEDTISLVLAKSSLTSALVYFLLTGSVSLSSPVFLVEAIKTCLYVKSESKVRNIFEKYVRSVPDKAFSLFYSICWILKACVVTQLKKDEFVIENEDSLLLNPLVTEKTNVEDKSNAFNEKITNGVSNAAVESVFVVDSSKINISNSKSYCSENKENNEVANQNTTQGTKTECRNLHGKLLLSSQDRMLHFICNLIIGARPAEIVENSFDPSKFGFFKLNDIETDMLLHGQVIYQE